MPATNAAWWRAKFDVIQNRDRRNERQLAAAGWTVLRIWEHEPVHQAADRIQHLLNNDAITTAL